MDENTAQAGWQAFLELCLQAKSTQQLDALLSLHLSPEEKLAMATRYLIIRDLIKGEKTQREMAKSLQVSIAKITRGSNSLKTTDAALLAFLKTHVLGKVDV